MGDIKYKKEKLIKHSANEVRNNKTLFADFVEIYVAEGGNKKDCYTCKFKTVFEGWRRKSPVIKKTVIMTNTFKLKNPKDLIYIPGGGGVVTAKSSDELVEKLFKAIKSDRIEAIKGKFSELPESMKPKKKASSKKEKVEPKPPTKSNGKK